MRALLGQNRWIQALIKACSHRDAHVAPSLVLSELLELLLLLLDLNFYLLCEKREYTRFNFINYFLVLKEFDAGIQLCKSLKHCSRHEHDLDNIYLCFISQIKENEQQIDFVLNQFGVVHQVLLVRLTKVRQQDYDAQNLKHIDDLHALWILDLKQFIKAFSIVSWVQQEGLSCQLTEFLLSKQIREVEIFLYDALDGPIELKRRPKQLLYHLAQVLWRIQFLSTLLHEDLAFSFKSVTH